MRTFELDETEITWYKDDMTMWIQANDLDNKIVKFIQFAFRDEVNECSLERDSVCISFNEDVSEDINDILDIFEDLQEVGRDERMLRRRIYLLFLRLNESEKKLLLGELKDGSTRKTSSDDGDASEAE